MRVETFTLFEIRYIPGAPGDRNHEIVRESKAAA